MGQPKNILITVQLDPSQLEELRQFCPDAQISSKPLSQGETLPDDLWRQAEILYTFRSLPQPEQAPNLRWIQFHSAGIEEHLDSAVLHQPTVQATTLSGANAPQVAEHALALMLALGHHIHEMLADQNLSKWPTQRGERYQPKELMGSTVGIVGYGSIGQRLARLLQSFGVTILASKRDLLSDTNEDYQVDGQGDPRGEMVLRIYPGEALGTMLKACDYIVVTVPLTQKTRGLLGARQLANTKPSALLIDVSRGGVIDQDALIQALQKRQLAGAALDVFPVEPLPADNPLWHMPNVIISPHVAGFSPQYEKRAFELFKENLRRYIANQELLNKINLERGY
jgi:phosphoglycerate dehydrogenase-like enzyme